MEVSYFEKVKKFIEFLPNEPKAEVISLVDVLEKSNRPLLMPYSKNLGNRLFELRTNGEILVRIFYCFHKNKAYLLHGIIKKSQKIPKKDIDYARKIQKLVESL